MHLFPLLGLAIGFLMLAAFIILIRSGFTPRDLSRRQLTFSGVVILVGLDFMVGGCSAWVTHFDQQQEQQVKYDSSVASWLAADYGIKATPSNAHKLIKGEAFPIAYKDHKVTISIIEGVDGNLTLVDDKKVALEPLS